MRKFAIVFAYLALTQCIIGCAGPKGDTGDRGSRGVAGAQGPVGPQGEQGDTTVVETEEPCSFIGVRRVNKSKFFIDVVCNGEALSIQGGPQ